MRRYIAVLTIGKEELKIYVKQQGRGAIAPLPRAGSYRLAWTTTNQCGGAKPKLFPARQGIVNFFGRTKGIVGLSRRKMLECHA
ncbi:MAG: hypothetical protein AUF65_02320 [Chloroflexi bacterium 13_1_20CM_50_12]|nr:MAG: hypothetical protein AUF65_02320 [Chloroflexi bacterium 13_1_20CM_50_12]